MSEQLFLQESENVWEILKKNKRYWLDILSGEITNCFFPYDTVYHQSHGDKERYEFVFPESLCTRLLRLCNDSDHRLFTVLVCGLAILLYKYTGNQDIFFVVPINKQRASGDFVNSILVLKNKVLPGSSFKELVYLVYRNIKEAGEHQNYPLKRLLAELTGSGQAHPVFETAVLLENIHEPDYLKDFATNIVFAWRRTAGTISGTVEYNPFLYKRETIQRIVANLETLYLNALENPEQLVKELVILTKADLDKVLIEFNRTDEQFEKDKTIQELFEEQVSKTPENKGVVHGGRTVTYRELNAKANHLAEILRAKGVTSNTIVGLLMSRSVEMLIGILGILKAGGAYLPIDPHYPKERIDYILADTKAKLILTNQEYTLPTDFHAETLLVNEAFLGEKPNLPLINSPSDLAYVIYTSGSTGKPKGVMLEHRGIANLKCFFEKKLGITSAERIAQFATCSFDASVWEIFMALLNGASLYLVDEDIINDYTKFGRFLHDNQITVVTLPPPYLVNLEWKGDLALKKIITAGSATNIELVNKWKDKVEYYNAYGPTETTICATVWREEGNPLEQLVPIGTPIYNTKVYIMNTDHQVQPIGVPGELCISGVGLARGYLNRPELTKERFVANPYLPGQVMYKTGDLARWLPDGNIEFLGRIDEQVKIRGYRVEIGEIEIVISSHEKVKEAAVVTKRDKNGEMYLVAYYTSDSLPADELRAYLSEKLPEYMIPSFLFKIDKIPVTPSGKFDKKYLQSIEESSLFRPQFEPPRTELEKKLVKIWEEVLGVPQVGINDCFLDLGGHSLKAIEAVYKMHKEGMDIKVGDLFRFPKLKDLAEHLGKQNRKQLIKDLTEANKELVKEFGTNVRLISYEVNSHPKLVLYIGRELSAKRLQILKYLKEKLDPSLCPHYLRFASDFAALGKETRLDEVGFEKALGFTAKHWWNYLAVLGHLFRMTKKYTKTVRKGIAITRSKPVAIQKIHLKLANQISGNIYTFDEFVYDSGLLRKAIALVVKEQAVLRSVFVKRKKEIWWEEREPKGELRIPFLDLSQWKTKCRERMGALLASYYFRKNLFRYNMPLYTPILIKENYRKHHLLFPCDHSIFDGMSGEILYRKIKDYYRKIEENPDEEGVNVSTAPSYLDYLKTLEKGPQFIDERQLIATFQLEHFYESLVEIGKNQKRSVPCLLEREINLPPEIRKSGLDSIWDMTFYLFVRLCHRYFNIPTVPARIVYYGRHYGQQTFFDTLGEFIDVVPVCVPMEKAPDQMDTIASLVRKLLAQIPEKNLNFVNLMYNNNSNAKWEKVSRLLFLPSPSTPWLLFNFQGNFSVDEIQKIKNLFNHNKTVKKFPKTQNNLLLFNVMYSAEKIYITLNCSYGYDHEKLMKILREETERIFYNHK